ncbi:hypothetical protein PoB_000543700 [Plakobranchus ocellatus]|uniref:Uncharacterized protein n=1 Tax=Plakobranchus ocellatus TaxID=259542 RepID=A0AAV3Y821_9GAST|nr:hypothetical protein PoB_000543700 [Plakobranchus ocellatus]
MSEFTKAPQSQVQQVTQEYTRLDTETRDLNALSPVEQTARPRSTARAEPRDMGRLRDSSQEDGTIQSATQTIYMECAYRLHTTFISRPIFDDKKRQITYLNRSSRSKVKNELRERQRWQVTCAGRSADDRSLSKQRQLADKTKR